MFLHLFCPIEGVEWFEIPIRSPFNSIYMAVPSIEMNIGCPPRMLLTLLLIDKTYHSYRIGEENLTSTQQAIAQEDFLLREPRPCLEDQIHLREDLFKITSKLQGINASSRPFGGEQPYFMDDNHDTFYPYNKPFVD